MSAMNPGEQKQSHLDDNQLVAEILAASEATLQRAREVLGVEDLATVLPGVHEKRDNATGSLQTRPLSKEETDQLVASAGELGFGAAGDVSPSSVGLRHGYTAFVEGGQAHKVMAEIVVSQDPEARPRSIIIAGSLRGIKAAEERRVTSAICQIPEEQVGQTEYEVALQIAAAAESFEPLEGGPVNLPFKYDIDANNQVSRVEEDQEPSGQFVRVGTINDAEVILMRIDREDYIDDSGAPKFRKQPNSFAALQIIGDVMEAAGEEHGQLALCSSGTYAPTRKARVARASLESHHEIRFTAYGTETIGAVRKAVMPEDEWTAPVNQVPEELAGLYRETELLKAALEQ